MNVTTIDDFAGNDFLFYGKILEYSSYSHGRGVQREFSATAEL